jgi:hypothetical protein
MRTSFRTLAAGALSLAFAACFATAAQAQMDCGSCTPTSSCDTECTVCRGIDYQDGSCSNPTTTTCGDAGGNTSGCIRSGCSPNFVESSRSNRGTYGLAYVVYCEHHRVDWVTQTDANQCNTNSAFWTNAFCQDTQDGYKWGTSTPDCCDGTPGFTCNHFHNC